MRFLPFIDSHSSVLNKVDDVCYLAKQSKNIFPISNNSRATTCFEIIHCDFWGKYQITCLCQAI